MTNLDKFLADPENKEIIKELIIDGAGITYGNKILPCHKIFCSSCKANGHCNSYVREYLNTEVDKT